MRWAATSVENRVCDGPLMWMRLEYLHGLWAGAVSWVTGRRPKAKGTEAATDAVDSEPGGKAGPVTEDEDCGAAGGIQREAGSACVVSPFPVWTSPGSLGLGGWQLRPSGCLGQKSWCHLFSSLFLTLHIQFIR